MVSNHERFIQCDFQSITETLKWLSGSLLETTDEQTDSRGEADQSADSRHPKFTEKLQQLHMKNISVRKAEVSEPGSEGSWVGYVQGALPKPQAIQGRAVSWHDTEFTKSLRLEKHIESCL